MKILILYSDVQVLKDFTSLLGEKEIKVDCMPCGGVSLISALQNQPDRIVIDVGSDKKGMSTLTNILKRKYLFRGKIYLYNTGPVISEIDIPIISSSEEIKVQLLS